MRGAPVLHLLTAALLLVSARSATGQSVSFQRDVLPLLSDRCFPCHGPDERARQADLRLDRASSAREGAFAVVVPGKSAESELYYRIKTEHADERMPPPDSNLSLTPAEVETLKRWIDAGAEWDAHWAFTAPGKPALPAVESGWDVRALHRRIVTSATYRQSSSAAREAYAADPKNELLSRGARYRLPSWMLRDQALALGGLLVEELGGPPVKPYQPEGVWAEATFGTIRYEPDEGDALYRRGLYVFWRRIVAPTVFFDTASRQACEVRPTRTNSPLHALTTLNETIYVESARALAARAMRAGRDGAEDRIAWAFRLATARRPTAAELGTLAARWRDARAEYARHPGHAELLLGVGASPRDASLDAAEHAAYTVVCSVLLNLDEVLTRP